MDLFDLFVMAMTTIGKYRECSSHCKHAANTLIHIVYTMQHFATRCIHRNQLQHNQHLANTLQTHCKLTATHCNTSGSKDKVGIRLECYRLQTQGTARHFEHTATHCNTGGAKTSWNQTRLQQIVTQHTATHSEYSASHCNTSESKDKMESDGTAINCNTTLCNAQQIHCNALQHTWQQRHVGIRRDFKTCDTTHCNTLQHTANTLQRTAT